MERSPVLFARIPERLGGEVRYYCCRKYNRQEATAGRSSETLWEHGRVEGLMFGRCRPSEDYWTSSAGAATLTGQITLLTVEKAILLSTLVLWRTKFTLVMMLWVSTILYTALFVSSSKAGRGVGRGGGRGGSNKGKLDSRGRSKGHSSQIQVICNHCQTSGHI